MEENSTNTGLVVQRFQWLNCCSYFEHVEEAEWAVQVLKGSGKPVAATLCIGPTGDLNGVSPGDCAVKLVKAGRVFTSTPGRPTVSECATSVAAVGSSPTTSEQSQAPERGFLPPASEKHGSWGSGLEMHTKPWVRARYGTRALH
ncbi:UNVERIFIED_CONTAM: hypothetical protein FKN15_060937 [Acipenser sinensis]